MKHGLDPMARLVAVLTVSLIHAPALAQQIPNRAALDAILAGNGTFEDFERFDIATASAMWLAATPALDWQTVANNQGPGLVAYGATYSHSLGQNLQWNADAYYGLVSKTLLTYNTGDGLTISYAAPVAAMGLDVTNFVGYGDSGLATVKDGAGAVLGTVPFTLTGLPNERAFVGWQHAAGIGSVELQHNNLFFSPIIDDHAYAIDPNTVATKTGFGAGCNIAFASFYEVHGAFDLSNTSLTMIPAGGGYVVTLGANPVVPPTSSPVALSNDQVRSMPLGWTLPYNGGTTTDLHVAANGFVGFAPGTPSHFGYLFFNPHLFLTNGPVVAAKASDLDPGAGGSVYLDTDPVNGTATVTFDAVPDIGTSNANTFQYHFDSSGIIEVRFGTCATTAGVTGWSPGLGNADPGNIDISAQSVILVAADDSVPLRLEADVRPVTGVTVDLTLSEIPAGSAIAAVIYGLTKHEPGLSLSGIGMPGCFQFGSHDAVVLYLAPGASVVSAFPVPNDPGLSGVHVIVQGAIHDPSGGHNQLGSLSSNGVDLGISTL